MLLPLTARAVVVHPGGEVQPPSELSSSIGRWGSNASLVAVAPNYVITTRHQGGGVGTRVELAGTEYRVSQQWITGSADIRVAQIETLDYRPANLPTYVPTFSISDGLEPLRQQMLVGGWGDTRGQELIGHNTGEVYGYSWAATGNRSQTWGTNVIDRIEDDPSVVRSWTSWLLQADYDGPDHSPTEGAAADHDSGGGWFHQTAEGWRVIGLNAYVAKVGESCFSSPRTGSDWPDSLSMIRVRSYSDWINSVADPFSVPPGDANWDGAVNELDLEILNANWGLANMTWREGDFNGDSMVNLLDFSILSTRYQGGDPIAMQSDFVPEPTSLIILAAGFFYIRRRK
ncbi:MAG: dockerin type I domain-containing protein [Phycisphaerae bacterium]